MYQITEQWQTSNRASHYGDGVFTTMRVNNGNIALWTYHQQRLMADTAALFLPPPNSELFEQAKKRAQLLGNGVLKLVLSAGEGGRGYSRPDTLSPTAHFFTSPMPTHYEKWRKQGVSVAVSSIEMASQPLLAGVKHLNRLEQVFIKRELSALDEDEVLVFDNEKHLVESSTGNVFIINSRGQWLTPRLLKTGVKGVMRTFVIDELRRMGQDVIETSIPLSEILHAKAIAITNALMGCVPVAYLAYQRENWHFDIEPILQFAEKLKGDKC